MKHIRIFSYILFLLTQHATAQVILNADGIGNTYELINSVLAPGNNVIEAPDCSHTPFGRHIDEIFDAELNTNVFRFHIHATEDDDRCINTDRQRNEIKVYDKSPDNLKAIESETVIYKWKFKIDAGFQSTPNFTHIHQLKSVGGLYEATPMYTLTTRKGTPDKLELRYAETSSQVTLKQTDLTVFKGIWVDVTETIKYGVSGTYSLEMNKVSDGTSLFSYANNAIVNWQTGADFVRPKWGIYRSLISVSDLRDETMLFNNFSIEEVAPLSIDHIHADEARIKISPNPVNGTYISIHALPYSYNAIRIYDHLGKLMNHIHTTSNTLDVSSLKSGTYFMILKKDKNTVSSKKLIIK
ncbi:T9SS type A sorting domain-containing protein [Mariniflexile sp. AS56]|uniref:T9SS type A sorting domain-containing protein n=1 Tax=Mariniflexile sp. AS56 TaxID=3063957 RepID=UPI0026F1375D|nr:T9SS type A sorting domain-containing protein [Mariniflexile sp. AS56]MDO7173926.1 T9SS type A sorting domain-containing protein [Mariniflexile sp. AS56]